MSKAAVIRMTAEQHRELLLILMRYSVQQDSWAISPALKRAITEASTE